MKRKDCILCKVLWILHLSRKTEDKNTILLAGFYEIAAWGITFGDICIFLSVRMRGEGTTQVLWGRQAIDLLDSQGSSRVRTHLSGPLTSQASSFPLWIPEGLDCPPRSPYQFYPVPKHPTATSVLKSQPNSAFYHMCALSKAFAVCTSVSSYVSWANQSNCFVKLLQN